MTYIELIVEAKPQGQARPRVVSKGGRTWAFSPKNDFRTAIKNEILKNANKINSNGVKMPYNGAIGLFGIFYIKRPKSALKTQFLDIKKPDLDNLEKALMDAISDSGIVWKDDSQVCVKGFIKGYSDTFQGVIFQIVFIGDNDENGLEQIRAFLGSKDGQGC